MKLLKAFVRADRVGQVVGALEHARAPGITVSVVRGAEDKHQKLFGRSCDACHGTDRWQIAGYRHPSPRSRTDYGAESVQARSGMKAANNGVPSPSIVQAAPAAARDASPTPARAYDKGPRQRRE